ncbi:uncharacterized protein LOC109848707 isoform X2 [Asparagus officinalis]|nr:uncharacterized protein LOC109848707 isoform X2 [Asparagus officinalis]
MDLGALMDMPSIRQHTEEKLAKRQVIYHSKLLSSYRDMASSVAHMVQSSSSLRCFFKASSVSSFVQFCNHPEDASDPGDGGGVPVFSFLSISNFENLAQELIEMFLLELNLKRLLVVELLSSIYKEGDEGANLLGWCYELYPGEFDDLRMINMFSSENNEPLPPRIKDWQSGDPSTHQSKCPRNHDVLQVYLTAWLADVNIDMNRMREIFSIVEDEIQVKLS